MWEGPAHWGSATCEKVVLGSIRKQGEQAMMNKWVSSIPPWTLLQFCAPGSCLVGVPALTSLDGQWPTICNTKKPLPPMYVWAVFSHSNRNKTKTLLRLPESPPHSLFLVLLRQSQESQVILIFQSSYLYFLCPGPQAWATMFWFPPTVA